MDDKERRKWRLLSQAPLFSSFIRISFSRLLPVSLECFWRRSTASDFLLAFTPCGQLRRRPVGGGLGGGETGLKKEKKSHMVTFVKSSLNF